MTTLQIIINLIAAGQAGAVIALSIIVILHYSRHRSMEHIALVATSYVLITSVVAASIIFHIFQEEGWMRNTGTVVALIAFGLGDFAIWKVWHSRKEISELKELQAMSDNIVKLNAQIAALETEMHEVQPVVTLPDVVNVKIVDPDEDKGNE